jgi:hypothetical protein
MQFKNTENVLPKGHTQIIHFIGDVKRTIRNVQKIWENEWTHIISGSDREWIINKKNVLYVEIIRKKETNDARV